MKKITTLLIVFSSLIAYSQYDTTIVNIISDKIDNINMESNNKRPYMKFDKLPLSIGGYAEANWQHIGNDGISEGHQFQMRRLSIFLAKSIHKKIKFISEIEFEDGGKEIAVEYAAIDLEFNPLFNLRSGIILNPIGAFNQNHDGPKWEFVDRPLSATQMLPDTWSNAGFGIFGKYYKNKFLLAYEFYLSGGFDNSIIDNELGKTFLPSSKLNEERFEESFSGEPLKTLKITLKHNNIGEIGLSYMGGTYNKYQNDGIELDKKRKLKIFAIDYNNTIKNTNTNVLAECAWVNVQTPKNYFQQYGSKQFGAFIDLVQPIIKRKIFDWENSIILLSCRLEYVDWNIGKFIETNQRIGDETWSILPAISFRPSSELVIRLNYRFQKVFDIFYNDPAKIGGFSLGISSYF